MEYSEVVFNVHYILSVNQGDSLMDDLLLVVHM